MNESAIRVVTAPFGKTHIFSVGQAEYIIKSASGKLLAIDFYLSECVERVEGNVGFKRLLPKIVSPFDLTFDVVITTHPHKDHFDIDAVPEMMSNGETKLYASVDCKELINKLEMTEKNVSYVKPVDNGGGVGMTVAYNEAELVEGVKKALDASNKKRFIVEKYMLCDDMGKYYTFKDGYCSALFLYYKSFICNCLEGDCYEKSYYCRRL